MKDSNEKYSPLYSASIVEFVTVAKEFCNQLDHCQNYKRQEFMDRISKILPLLYIKTALLPELISSISDNIENFVTEDLYNSIRSNIACLLGEMDNYLDTQITDMQYSEGALPASISENLSDIYQDLKDMILNFKSANSSVMLESILFCKDNFKTCWGQKLVSSLGAIHNALYSPNSDFTDNDLDEKEDDTPNF